MTGKHRLLMIGAGGMAGNWIRRILPPFFDRVEIVGLVDLSPAPLKDSGDFLNLPENRRFADVATAVDSVEADCCAIVIPPAFHKDAALNAARRGLAILSEKPIADTWGSAIEIYRAVKAADVKMQVIQNYRFNAPMVTMRHVLTQGDLGRINYVVGRFADDYREWGSWGTEFRYTMPHALLVEGGVHHFDQLRNLTGGNCATITGWEWNPPWSASMGEFNCLYAMRMTNGVHATYEGSGTAAGEQNSWHEEYNRAECEFGAVAVGRDHVVRVHRSRRGGSYAIEEVPMVRPAWEGHQALVAQFLDWLEGGPRPPTVIDDNLQTAAMLFAAIEASRLNQTVDVQAMLTAAIG